MEEGTDGRKTLFAQFNEPFPSVNLYEVEKHLHKFEVNYFDTKESLVITSTTSQLMVFGIVFQRASEKRLPPSPQHCVKSATTNIKSCYT